MLSSKVKLKSKALSSDAGPNEKSEGLKPAVLFMAVGFTLSGAHTWTMISDAYMRNVLKLGSHILTMIQ